MTALAADKIRYIERWCQKQFTLASGTKAYKGAQIVIQPGTGKIIPFAAGSGLTPIGVAAQQVDATSADQTLNIDLCREVEVEWLANSGTNPVAATDLGAICYGEDDQTVGIAASGFSAIGRVWGYSATKGVAVERISGASRSSLAGMPAGTGATLAWTSNNVNVASNPASGTVYDVPTTGAASTVTLPATSQAGTLLYFKADGTKNGHTVQYRDATGPVNLTTALTASKRHLVVAEFDGTNWYANAYVSP